MTTAMPSAQTAGARLLALDVLPETSQSQALKLWREFQQEHGCERLACSYEWTSLWLAHYGDLVPHEFHVARAGNDIVGIALVTFGADQFNGPVRIKTRHIGTAGEPDDESVCVEYNSLACVKEHRPAFLAAIVEHLRTGKDWDRVYLEGFDDRELIGIEGETRREFLSHYFDLNKARQAECEPLALLGKSTKKAIKRTRNAVGPLQVEWATGAVDGLDIFEELVDLHQARWTAAGEPGVYSSPRFTAFHRDAVCNFVPTGQMVLVRVSAEDQTVGCGQYLVEQNRMLFYQGGWSEFGRNINPGMLFHYKCIEDALRRNFDAYDFLKGGARYKTSLSTDTNTLVWAYWERPTIKSAVVKMGRRAKAAIRTYRSRRQNP